MILKASEIINSTDLFLISVLSKLLNFFFIVLMLPLKLKEKKVVPTGLKMFPPSGPANPVDDTEI